MKKSTNLTTSAIGDDVKTALRTSYNVSAVPRLTVDWNLNRYTTPTATNTPSEDTDGKDIERFPIESIVEPLRPKKGAAKARVNEAVVSAGYIKSDTPRFYVSDTEDVYKYWTAPYTTNGSGVFPNHTDSITTARPRVSYDRVVKANKIVIIFENTWATPTAHTVWLQSALAGGFSQIGGSNPVINGAEGTLTLYFNGTAWVSTRPATLVETDVAGIELRVTAMGAGIMKNGQVMSYRVRTDTTETLYPTTGANSSLNVIAIEAHREVDLTSRLQSVSDTFDMSESSQLYPIGTITSNTGSVTLSNEDGLFNPENSSSTYYGLIEPNAEFNLEYIYTIGATKYSVQQFKMYSAEWSDSDGLVEVSLEDYSKFLKEIKPNSFMVEEKSSTEIIWRVLDSVGFVDYEIQDDDIVDNTIIPVFWTTGEETVWEVLDEVAKATQTAIYIDGKGKLQVRTRQAAFRDSAAVDWNLLGFNNGANLTDIISWSPNAEYEANKIEVTYKTTKWKVSSKGKPAMSRVWEPDQETLTVRSSPLKRDITDTSVYIYLDPKETKIWPFKSKVQIDGEVLSYDGKQFIYYTYTENVKANGTIEYITPVKNSVVVKSEDDYKKYNRMSPVGKRHKNYYTGGLFITGRELWNTEKRNHTVDINGWSTKMELSGKGTPSYDNAPHGFKQNKLKSTVTLETPKRMKDTNDTYWATRGGPASSGYKAYGTRFKFNKDKAAKDQVAGFAYQLSGTKENGYYVEIRNSSDLGPKGRKEGSEVRIYSQVAGKKIKIAGGADTAIARGIWYHLDIYHSGSGNNQRISVWINGQKVAEGTTDASSAQADSGRFGFFAKGRTSIDFEYIYAIARNVPEPVDDFGFYDLVYGGIRGDAWQREYVWETRTRTKKIQKKNQTKEKYRHNLYLFDEFGPYVHEVREFDVSFDPNPVRYSYLFNTNEWYSAVVEYSSTPFGAKFIISNVGRDHAVIHGEDNLVFAGAGSAVNQVCVALGQNLEIADEETVERKNLPAIRSRGLIESELGSQWIQSKSMAETLADWMAKHWSDSVDSVDVEIFGNPLIEVGDIVDVNYPVKNATPATHVYYVVGVSNSFEAGITTTLTLRRKRTATTIS